MSKRKFVVIPEHDTARGVAWARENGLNPERIPIDSLFIQDHMIHFRELPAFPHGPGVEKMLTLDGRPMLSEWKILPLILEPEMYGLETMEFEMS